MLLLCLGSVFCGISSISFSQSKAKLSYSTLLAAHPSLLMHGLYMKHCYNLLQGLNSFPSNSANTFSFNSFQFLNV